MATSAIDDIPAASREPECVCFSLALSLALTSISAVSFYGMSVLLFCAKKAPFFRVVSFQKAEIARE